MRAVRLLLLVSLLGLAGCDLNWDGDFAYEVVSNTPMFGKADILDGPALKDGMWTFCARGEDSCNYDYTDFPVRAANPTHRTDRPFPDPGSRAFLLASGAPAILQVAYHHASGQRMYYYFALKPVARDAEGRVTVMKAWRLLCEPPQSDEAMAHRQHHMWDPAKTLLPGLYAMPNTAWCFAATPQAVRGAAHASEQWNEMGEFRWYRDATTEDNPAFAKPFPRRAGQSHLVSPAS